MDLLDQILKAAEVGETSDWEFKSAKGGFPGSFWETYSAMANTDGGTIVLGVREKNGKAELDGLLPAQINSYLKILWDDLNNRSKINRNLLSPSHVNVEKNFLIIRIPRATRTERPIYVGPIPFQNTYRRCFEGDYHCTDEEVRRMFADADSLPRDQRILKNFTIEDIDLESLNQYRNLFSALKYKHPWSNLTLEQLLEKLGGWRKDRDTGIEGITLAGLLMFGRYQAITDPDAAPNYFVDYREKLDPENRWTHRIYPDGTWEANLFQFYQRIWHPLTSDIKVPFRLEGLYRIEDTPVHKAVREALVNALIHSDYSAPGGVVIERYRDRFVLDNPGILLVSIDQIRRGGISECRNKSLQQMFMLIGGGEKAGSGFDRIQSAWRDQHWRAPSLTTRNGPDRIRLEMPTLSIIPEPVLDTLHRRFGERFGRLQKLEVQALVTANLEKEVSNARLQELLNDHPVDISQVLQGLCSKGMLISDNKRRWAKYRIPNPNSPHNDPNSQHLEGNSQHLEGNSQHLEGNSQHLDLKLLESIAGPVARKKRVPKQQVRDCLLQICKGRHLSLNDLSCLLKRSRESLQNHYLIPMVSEGLLELQYPETPNRPDQAYTAKE